MIRNRGAISKLSLTTLLVVAGIIGALISYTFIMGYYISIGLRVPEEPSIVIIGASFSPQNATAFNVSILNPSYSSSNATVNQVKVITGDTVQSAEILQPSLRKIKPGELKNFTCQWNWSNDTGEEVRILAFITEGSGATFKATTPVMGITITGTYFNATETTHSFNVTVENQPSSVDYVNISKITVTADTVHELTPSPELPYPLNPGDSEKFKVPWTWTYYRNKSATITVHTLQGYTASYTQRTPLPVNLTITEAVFNEADTTHFNLTVQNSASFPAYANITRISVTIENGTSLDINETTPSLPNIIPSGASTPFTCSWNWTYYRGKSVTIIVHQLEGPTASYVQVTPPSVFLTITGAVFNVTETSQFNVTVRNSEFSVANVNITTIGVTPEGAQETVIANVTPALPRTLSPNSSLEFTCLWNWTEYQGESVTISVYAVGYTANYTLALPPQVNLTITEVLFNTTDTTSFNVTVQNPELSSIPVNITRITVRMENGTTHKITGITPELEYTLYPNTSVMFTCPWDWTNYRSKNATVTVYTREGYRANYTRVTPAEEESLNITKQHVWYDTSNSTSKAAFLIINTGGIDVVIENITVKGEECNWSSVYYNITGDTITADLPWISGTPSSVTLNSTSYILANASSNLTLQSGYAMIVYIVNPDSISAGDIGLVVGITIVTSQAMYYKECTVEAVT